VSRSTYPAVSAQTDPRAGQQHRGENAHGHSHGLIDPSIKRSRAGVRVVLISLALLGVTAAIQAAIYIATNSVALLADQIYNSAMRSRRFGSARRSCRAQIAPSAAPESPSC
jgi:hypothetical protein